MPILAHTNGDNRESAAAQTNSMVDIKPYNPEKGSKRKKKKIPTYEGERRNTGAAQNSIFDCQSGVHCSHQAGKK